MFYVAETTGDFASYFLKLERLLNSSLPKCGVVIYSKIELRISIFGEYAWSILCNVLTAAGFLICSASDHLKSSAMTANH